MALAATQKKTVGNNLIINFKASTYLSHLEENCLPIYGPFKQAAKMHWKVALNFACVKRCELETCLSTAFYAGLNEP